ncbi:hypothetical protein CDIK_4521 [Cucumispora dikerogammari]|nr:hypothetical protein CDIK_4521 [Cucumispora dikerogammari]
MDNPLNSEISLVRITYRDIVLKKIYVLNFEAIAFLDEEIPSLLRVTFKGNKNSPREWDIYNIVKRKNGIFFLEITILFKMNELKSSCIVCFDYERTWCLFTKNGSNLFNSL